MSREIVLDTETTGIETREGHRVIEIAAIELFNLLPTGRFYHVTINPERDIPADATRIHGFTNADVEKSPLFAAVVDPWLEFMGDAPIIAHNALLDVKLLAKVYLELRGGRQPGLVLTSNASGEVLVTEERKERSLLPILVPPEREEAHKAFLAKIKDPIWLREAG